MATTVEMRDAWYLYRCSYGTPTNMFGRAPVFAQNTSHVRALEQGHFNAGYYPTLGGVIGSKRNCPMGISGHKCEEDGGWCSLHNFGLAWDVEYNLNPMIRNSDGSLRVTFEQELWDYFEQGVTKYNPDIVNALLNITNIQGEQLFSWLGYKITDFMHWQLNVPPERQEVDWTSIGGIMSTLYRVGVEDGEWEPEAWRIYLLMGGTVDANANSSQIIDLMPWKETPPGEVNRIRVPQLEDFVELAKFIGLSSFNLQKLIDNGLYKFGKELASLEDLAYRKDVG